MGRSPPCRGFAGLVFERPFISEEWAVHQKNLPIGGGDEIPHSETWGKMEKQNAIDRHEFKGMDL